ncbi:hypothetical protein ABIE26_002799 [Pedobacter africanus]|uniref:Uncharacterized protein n=1 Tax=Pedobacter africanus TaxID=151894 RepID=A0ACC6KXA5_9SPHI|nr:hypothetical protein [Pedobacter africanus]
MLSFRKYFILPGLKKSESFQDLIRSGQAVFISDNKNRLFRLIFFEVIQT